MDGKARGDSSEDAFNSCMMRLMRAGSTSICSLRVQLKDRDEDAASFLQVKAVLLPFSLQLFGVDQHSSKRQFEVFLPLSFAVLKNQQLQILTEDDTFTLTPSLLQNNTSTSIRYFTKLCHSIARRCLLPVKTKNLKNPTGLITSFKACDSADMNCFCLLSSALLSKQGPFARSLPDFGFCCSDGTAISIYYYPNDQMSWLSKATKLSKNISVVLVLATMFQLVSYLAGVGLEVQGLDPMEDFIFGLGSFQFISLNKLRFSAKIKSSPQDYLSDSLKAIYSWLQTCAVLDGKKHSELKKTFTALSLQPLTYFNATSSGKDSPFRFKKPEKLLDNSIEEHFQDPLPLGRDNLLNFEAILSSEEMLGQVKPVRPGSRLLSSGNMINGPSKSFLVAEEAECQEIIVSMGFSDNALDARNNLSSGSLSVAGEFIDEGVQGHVFEKIFELQLREKTKKFISDFTKTKTSINYP